MLVAGFPFVDVTDGLHVDGDAVRRPDLVLPPVEPPDRRRVVVDRDPPASQQAADLVRGRHDLAALLEQGQHGDLRGRDVLVQAQHDPFFPTHFLLAIRINEKREQAPVGAGRGLDDVRHDVRLPLLVEIGQ